MSHSRQSDTPQNTPGSILESLALLTAQRDRELLARTLVSTLAGLIHSNRITMYRILPTDQGEEAILAAEVCSRPDEASVHPEANIAIRDRADFNAVFHSGKESERRLDNKKFLSVYPIVGEHGVVGMVEVSSKESGDADKRIILALLEVYSNHQRILDESETDTLTGLLNRRTFDNNIEKIIAEHSAPDEAQIGTGVPHPARRKDVPELPHWLAIIDIDFFKRINDKFGHLYGDEVLLLLSRSMQRIFRQRDKLFRFGGEEFIVVLDRTDEDSAKGVLDRFRVAIEQYDFPQVGRVTISIGFVRLDKVDVSSVIIGRADQALYYAKQHGRNQVCCYEDLVAEGKLEGEHYSHEVELF